MKLFSKLDPRKGVGIVIGIIFYSLCILAFSFAYYVWKSEDTDVVFNISDPYFYCESGIENNVGSLSPVLDYRLGSYDKFGVDNIGMYDTSFSVSMNISQMDDSLKNESFKYKLMVDTSGVNDCSSTSNSSCVEVGSGDFSDMKVGMNTLVSPLTLPNNVRYDYYLFLYIDGNMENDTSMQNSNITYTLEVCTIVVFLDYKGGTVTTEFLRVVDDYSGLPTDVDRINTTVIYEANGGAVAPSDSVSYVFDGWYLDEDTFEDEITSSSTVIAPTNHTLYAKWIPQNSVVLPTTSRTGYKFEGWYSDSGLTNKVGDAEAS